MERTDTYWMDRCMELALNGAGSVSPNPLVGAVLVKDGKILGEGYHERYGGPHAEINAIRNALKRGKKIRGATLYVNLEPCSHFGKTPPCVNAVIRHGITRVVIGTKDPNPLVAGKGITILKQNGISVRVGIRKKESEHLNETFFKFILTKIPFITLKAAQTQDGFIARKDGSSRWISNQRSRTFVHHLRNAADAVLVGAGTVEYDDPLLTVRAVKGKNPVRVILDGRFRVASDRRIFGPQAPTLIYTTHHALRRQRKKAAVLRKKGVTIVPIRTGKDTIRIRSVVEDLGRKGIASLLVEGGAKVYSSFFNARMVDSLRLFTSPKKFTEGIKTFDKLSVSFKKRLVLQRSFGNDNYREYRITFL